MTSSGGSTSLCMDFHSLRTQIANWHFCRAKSAQMFNLFTRCCWMQCCARGLKVFFPCWVEASRGLNCCCCCAYSPVMHWATRQPKNYLSPLEITLAVFHQSKPSIKHPASSLSLFKRIRDVAAGCVSSTLSRVPWELIIMFMSFKVHRNAGDGSACTNRWGD